MGENQNTTSSRMCISIPANNPKPNTERENKKKGGEGREKRLAKLSLSFFHFPFLLSVSPLSSSFTSKIDTKIFLL